MILTKDRNWFPLILAFLALLVGSLYVWFWRYAFSSDYAMIGLLAKRILTTGEQFIFVPQVGYQGLLYEANLVALMFKLFGVSPVTLNLAPFLTYLGFCVVFFGAVRAWHGKAVANLATLFIILSTPLFYGTVLRTVPNYGETFLMGTSLFWIYRKILDRFAQGSSALGLFGLFGLIAGFGYYTYGQIVYFLGAIGLHVLFLACYEGQFKWNRPIRFILGLSGLNFLFGFVALLFSMDKIQIGERILVKFMPLAMLESSIGLFVLCILMAATIRNWQIVKGWIPSFVTMALGMVIGVSPKFYYNWILKENSMNRMGISGDLPDIVKRGQILLAGQKDLLNFSSESGLSWLSSAAAVSLLGIFIFRSCRGLGFHLRNSKTGSFKNVAVSVSPFFFMIAVIILSFLAAGAVTDYLSFRYAAALILSYCVGFSVVIVHAFGSSRFSWKRLAALCSFCLILTSNTLALGRSFFSRSQSRFN